MPAEAADAVRDYLLAAAHGGHTRRLRQCIAKLATVFPNDDGVPESENTQRNEFWASQVVGRVVVKGDLDTETGNMLLAALSPLTEPRPTTADGPGYAQSRPTSGGRVRRDPAPVSRVRGESRRRG